MDLGKIIGTISYSNHIFYITSSGWIGTGIILNSIDIELGSSRPSELLTNLYNFESENMRVKTYSDYVFSTDPIIDTARYDDIKELGKFVFRNYVTFEKKLSPLLLIKNTFKKEDIYSSEAKEILQNLSLDVLKSELADYRLCNIEDYKKFSIADCSHMDISNNTIAYEGLFYSVIKLWEPSNNPINPLLLSAVREQVGVGHRVVSSIWKKNKARFLLSLKRDQKQTQSATSRVDAVRHEGAQHAEEDLELNGLEIFAVDMTFLIWGKDKEEVENRSLKAKNALLKFGYFVVEKHTKFRSFLGCFLGNESNYSVIEDSNSIGSYFPIFHRGPSTLYSNSPRSMGVNRSSSDIEYVDLFNSYNSNYSAIVIGKMGLGKSVLLNTLLRCMLYDDNLSIILVDVKGSYKRTVSLFPKSAVFNLKLGEATGINPFLVASMDKIELRDKVELIKEFIKSIIKKPEEPYLDQEISGILEECLLDYCAKVRENPTLTDFVSNYSKRLPRIEYLKRWCIGGMFEKVFMGLGPQASGKRISYYNFEEIYTASNPEIARAVIAAITCYYNTVLLSKPRDHRLVFMADETPFFIKECFDFFKLTNKNVRKLNGSMILAAQSSSDLIVNGDTSLIDNVDTKFLFSVDGNEDSFRDRFHLNKEQYDQLLNCESQRGNFSSFILIDKRGFRPCYLILSKSEYWRSTSKAEEVSKIEKLKQFFPEFTNEQCIKIVLEQSI